MNVLNLLSELVKAIGLFINPKQNATLTQRIGSFLSILTVLGMLAGAVNTLLPVDVPEPGASPDVVQPLDVPTPGDVHEDVPAGILGTIGAALSAPFGCSAAQVRQMRIAGTDALACLTQCGASEAVTTLHDYGDDGAVKLTWRDATKDMLKCAEPCLWNLGIATFNTYAIGLPYCGSASEPSVYGGSMTEIVVSPRKPLD